MWIYWIYLQANLFWIIYFKFKLILLHSSTNSESVEWTVILYTQVIPISLADCKWNSWALFFACFVFLFFLIWFLWDRFMSVSHGQKNWVNCGHNSLLRTFSRECLSLPQNKLQLHVHINHFFFFLFRISAARTWNYVWSNKTQNNYENYWWIITCIFIVGICRWIDGQFV